MRKYSLVALIIMVALAITMGMGAQDQHGYYEKLLGLHDLNNQDPTPELLVLDYDAFVETGDLCGVKYGISMTQAVEAWG